MIMVRVVVKCGIGAEVDIDVSHEDRLKIGTFIFIPLPWKVVGAP